MPLSRMCLIVVWTWAIDEHTRHFVSMNWNRKMFSWRHDEGILWSHPSYVLGSFPNERIHRHKPGMRDCGALFRILKWRSFRTLQSRTKEIGYQLLPLLFRMDSKLNSVIYFKKTTHRIERIVECRTYLIPQILIDDGEQKPLRRCEQKMHRQNSKF